MFIHAPKNEEVVIHALVLWDDPDMGVQAVQLLREIEERVPHTQFQIDEAEARHLREDPKAHHDLRSKANLLLVALQPVPEKPLTPLRHWIEEWTKERGAGNGALAVLHHPPHVQAQEFQRLVHQDPGRLLAEPEDTVEFQEDLKELADQHGVDFLTGVLESDLEEATRSLRFLPPS